MTIFKNKLGDEISLEDLYREIYINSVEKRTQIKSTFDTVSNLIKDLPSAVNLLPEVTKLQQVAVNNDDQLIKLAAIIAKTVAKLPASTSSNDGYELTDEERQQLFAAAKESYEQNIPGTGK